MGVRGAGARGLIAARLKQIGIPVLNLEVDCIDSRNFVKGQLRNRLEAFIEWERKMYYLGVDNGNLSCDALMTNVNEKILATSFVHIGASNLRAVAGGGAKIWIV